MALPLPDGLDPQREARLLAAWATAELRGLRWQHEIIRQILEQQEVAIDGLLHTLETWRQLVESHDPPRTHGGVVP